MKGSRIIFTDKKNFEAVKPWICSPICLEFLFFTALDSISLGFWLAYNFNIFYATDSKCPLRLQVRFCILGPWDLGRGWNHVSQSQKISAHWQGLCVTSSSYIYKLLDGGAICTGPWYLWGFGTFAHQMSSHLLSVVFVWCDYRLRGYIVEPLGCLVTFIIQRATLLNHC